MGLLEGKWLRPDVPFRPSRAPFFYGWVIVGASVMGMASSMPGQTAGVGPFTESLMEHLELSRVQLSGAYLVGTAASGIILPRIGRFFDRYGARVTGTLVEIAFGMALFYMAACSSIYLWLKPSSAPAPWLALTLVTVGFFMIRFLGQGVIAMVSRAMLGKWFNRKRGLASAVGGSIGSVCFSASPSVLYILVAGLGWREAWVLMGFILMTIVAGLCWLLYRDNPEECGLQMDGEDPPAEREKDSDPEFTVYKEFTGPEAIRTYPFWVFTGAFSLQGIFATAVVFHGIDIARDHGVSATYFFSLYIFMSMVNIPCGFLFGWMTGRMRLKKLLITMGVAMAAGSIGLTQLTTTPGLIVYVVSFGICGALFGTLMAVAYPRFFGRKHLGAVSGWAMLSLVISSAIAPLAWSLSKTLTGTYDTAIIIFAISSAALALAAAFADNPQRKLAAPAGE